MLALVGGGLLLLLLMVTPLGLTRIQSYVVAGMGLLLSLLLLVFKSIYPLPIALVLVLLVAMVVMYGIWKKANHLLFSSDGNKELLEDYYNRLEVADVKNLDHEDERVNSPTEVVDEQNEDLYLEEINFDNTEDSGDDENLSQAIGDDFEFEVSEEDNESLIKLDQIEDHAREDLELNKDADDEEYVEGYEAVEAEEHETASSESVEEENQVGDTPNESAEETDEVGIDFSLRLESVLEDDESSSQFEESEEEVTVDDLAEEASGSSDTEDEDTLDEDLESGREADEEEDLQFSRSNDFESQLNRDSFDEVEEEIDEQDEGIAVETYEGDESLLYTEDLKDDSDENDSDDELISNEVVEDPSEQIAYEMVDLLREQASYLKNSGNISAYLNVTEQLLNSHLTDDRYFAVAAEYRDFLIVQKEWSKLNKLLNEMEERCEYPVLLEEIHYLKSLYKQK